MFKGIDLFSDTATRPSAAMRAAMVSAEVGDEQNEEDPTTRLLEDRAASLLGKASALFLPSATMANEMALRFHCRPGEALIAAENCHLFEAESGGPAALAQVLARPISTPTGLFTGEDIKRLSPKDSGPHMAVSRVVSVENTTNFGGGIPWPLPLLKEVVETAHTQNLKLHLDGARLINAAVRLKVSPSELANGFDTVTLCFSKGLGCPVGALLAFDKKDREEFRRLKQLFGGAMRQSGILAAACLYGLENNIDRLSEDHENAARLANGMKDLQGILLETPEPQTNMVFFVWKGKVRNADAFDKATKERGMRFSRITPTRFRAVTHLDISGSDIDRALDIVRSLSGDER